MSWDEWEDFAAGMYAPEVSGRMVTDSERLLRDPDRFHAAATAMVESWPVAARHNLDYMWTGRNAWVGQASCCFAHGATAVATRTAWGHLTVDEQHSANSVAAAVRERRERGNRGSQTLFAV